MVSSSVAKFIWCRTAIFCIMEGNRFDAFGMFDSRVSRLVSNFIALLACLWRTGQISASASAIAIATVRKDLDENVVAQWNRIH